MSILDVTIPQMGEGLQEARLLRFLKQPGEAIARDEPIFEMETDKATVQVEAPVAGTLVEWLVEPDTVLKIGAIVGRIRVDGTDESLPVLPPPITVHGETEVTLPRRPVSGRNALVPPRTRAYARERGVSEPDLDLLAESLGRKVMPADVDAFIQSREREQAEVSAEPAASVVEPLPPSQRKLVFRMQQRAAEVIAASEEIVVPWGPIDRVRAALKQAAKQSGIPLPTPFLVFAWCVVRAVERVPVLRCRYAGDGMIRRDPTLHLGLAVARDDDELLTAAVQSADGLTFVEFVERCTEAIKKARAGEDQASQILHLSLSNLSGMDIIRAVPIVVPPAVATLFVGSVQAVPVWDDKGNLHAERTATVTLTFDHRVVNGVGAARFLMELRRQVARLDAAQLLRSD